MIKFRLVILRISGLAFFLLAWQIISFLGIFDSTLFPSPSRTFSALSNFFMNRNLIQDIGYTLMRVFSGFFIATIFGILFGLIIGVNKSLYTAFEWLIDFFRSIPVVTIYPIFILLFGISHSTKMAMVFWATFWVITLNVAYGVRQSNKLRTEVAKVYKASKMQSFIWITFFEALPHTLIGMRIAISIALLAEIMSEMFMGANYGIGQRIFEANARLSTPDLYALVITTGIIGITINRLFAFLEKKTIPWAGK